MQAREVIKIPAVLQRLRRNAVSKRVGLRKLGELLHRRQRAIEVYEAFGAEDVFVRDHYDRAPRREESP